MKLKKSSIVSNAGPLIHLSKIDLLHLLKKLDELSEVMYISMEVYKLVRRK